MKIIKGDLWKLEGVKCITTNGIVKQNGDLVMGAGIALAAQQKYPDLPRRLGTLVNQHGNQCYFFQDLELISFPTKEHFKNKSTLKMIRRSLLQLLDIIDCHDIEYVYLPKPGCGYGGLLWIDVEKLISKYITNQIIIVSK